MEDFGNSIPQISIEEYSYELPDSKIAQYPVEERDTSKLLIYNKGIISQDLFRNITEYIPSGSLMVFNNTRVIRARLLFRKESGAAIEIFCLEPLDPSDYQLSFGCTGPVEWKCIIGNLKKWKKGALTSLFKVNNQTAELKAEKICAEGEAWRIRFSWNSDDLSFSEVTEAAGHIPLPPYVRREDESEDNIRYQTVYSDINGSVAAPTAGLHFTRKIISELISKGVRKTDLTLHIGAGTFKLVKAVNISEHVMHCEHFFVTSKLIEDLLRYEGKIIAVGTTSVRTLESLYLLGAKIQHGNAVSPFFHIEQWEPYLSSQDKTARQSLEALLAYMKKSGTSFIHGSTSLMIVPGYRFRIVNAMTTNFHQPKSTLLLLVSAFAGTDWKRIYRYALDNEFRFLSFGDTSLLLPHKIPNAEK